MCKKDKPKFLHLKNKNNKPENRTKSPTVPSIFLSACASMIDVCVLAIPRIVVLAIGGILCEDRRVELIDKIKKMCDGNVSKFSFSNKTHVETLIHSDYIKWMAAIGGIVISLGVIYRFLMWSSSWSATLGERMCRIVVVKKDSFTKLQITDVILRVLLVYLVWFFPPMVILLWSSKKYLSISLVILTSLWYDASFFGLKGRAVPDLFAGSVRVIGFKDVKFCFNSEESCSY